MSRNVFAPVLLAMALGGLVDAQQPSEFRARVDLLALDVVVLDARGQPVQGLTAKDFEVTLDGKRAVVRALDYVDFTRLPIEAAPKPSAAPAAPGGPAMPPRAADGRSILLGIDDSSFGGFEAQTLTSDLGTWLNTLNATDSVGLMTSSGRVSVPFSRDRSALVAGLRAASIGQRQAVAPGKVRLSIQEAKAVDENAPQDVNLFFKLLPQLPDLVRTSFARECPPAGEERTMCFRTFKSHAQTVAQEAFVRLVQTTEAFRAFLGALQSSPSPRTLVLVSAGLPTESSAQTRSVTKLATDLGAQIFIVTPASGSLGGAGRAEDSNRPSVVFQNETNRTTADFRRDDEEYLKNGLDWLADDTGGKVFRVMVGAGEMLANVVQSTSGVYRVGVEAPAAVNKAEGFPVRVRVNRSGTTVKTAATLRPAPPEATAAAAPPVSLDARMGDVVARGRSESGVPLEIAAMLQRDEASGQVRAIVSARVPAAAPGPLKVLIGFIDELGQLVRTGAGQLVAQPAQDYRGTFALALPPGRYRLRVAVADASSNVGSGERDVVLQLKALGAWYSSDLLMSWAGTDKVFRSWSLEQLPAEATIVLAALEMYPPDLIGGAPPDAELTVLSDDGRQVVGRPVPLRRVGTTFVASSQIQLQDLAPGRYEVRITARSGATSIGAASAFIVKSP